MAGIFISICISGSTLSIWTSSCNSRLHCKNPHPMLFWSSCPLFLNPVLYPYLSLALEPTFFCSAATNLSPCQPQPSSDICDSKEWRRSSRSCSVHEENGWVYCGRVFRRMEMVLGKIFCCEAQVSYTKFGKAASCWGWIIFKVGLKKKKKRVENKFCWLLSFANPRARSTKWSTVNKWESMVKV